MQEEINVNIIIKQIEMVVDNSIAANEAVLKQLGMNEEEQTRRELNRQEVKTDEFNCRQIVQIAN